MSVQIEVNMSKRVFVVLGMSRSGTSAIARSMSAMGIDLGQKLIAANEINPKGFFEDEEILYDVNRGVANLLDNPWISTDLFARQPLEANKQLCEYKKHALKLLKSRFSSTNNWGFKDPRNYRNSAILASCV